MVKTVAVCCFVRFGLFLPGAITNQLPFRYNRNKKNGNFALRAFYGHGKTSFPYNKENEQTKRWVHVLAANQV